MPIPMAKMAYLIDRRRHGLFFVCIKCGHEVDVSQFTNEPNRRTQAAAAMKAHVDSAHAVPYHYCIGPECEFCRQQREKGGLS